MSRVPTADGPPPEDAEYLPYQFDQAWRGGSPPDLAAFLPAASDETARRQVLQELVKIDLEYRWQQCSARPELRRTVEEYVALYPELGPEVSQDLIGWEYQARHSCGDRPSHAEYVKRFPAHGPQLEAVLSDVDARLAAEFASAEAPVAHAPGSAGPVTRVLAHPEISPLALPAPQAELVQPLESVGAFIGPYILLERLGEGGAGQVYKARHHKMDRLAAVKVIRPELLTDDEMVRRFYREVEAISQLQHDNIVHAYDAGPITELVQGGLERVRGHFLAMEFLEGIDLARLVKQSGPLPIKQAEEYICQAALGLQYIHEHGLVHRDIKPSNLMLSAISHRPQAVGQTKQPHADSRQPTAVVKILDLGLARLRQRGSGETSSTITGSNTLMMGTIDYMAPEQAIDSHTVDIRADIYSLGCTLFYLLTGRPPFPGGTEAEKLVCHQMKLPPDVRQLRPEVPGELAAILGRMLAKQPGKRFETPREFSQALRGEVPVTMIARAESAGLERSEAPVASQEAGAVLPSPASHRTLRRVAGPWLLGLATGLMLAFLLLILLWGRIGTTQTAVSVPAIDVNTIKDGGFETPNVALSSYLQWDDSLHTGFAFNPSGSPWTFSGSKLTWVNGKQCNPDGSVYTGASGLSRNNTLFTSGNPPAPEGTQVAFLHMQCSMSQAVNFSGGSYTLSFQAAQRVKFQDSSQTFQVWVDGNLVDTFTPLATTYKLYTTRSFNVAAGAHSIKFVGINPNGGENTAFIDQVRIQAVAPAAPKTSAR
jgi:serine/threonine-protein kinase